MKKFLLLLVGFFGVSLADSFSNKNISEKDLINRVYNSLSSNSNVTSLVKHAELTYSYCGKEYVWLSSSGKEPILPACTKIKK